ncbi:MAG: DUF72 domain-containing protein [Bryobacteraceae bacterium]
MTLPLFSDSQTPLARALAPPLRRLADRNIFVGTSSWKYEGWLGLIYDPERYKTRGKFSRRRFEDTCLAEFCGAFPTVSGDFAFYQFPSADFWQRLFSQVPPTFQFGFKVPEQITCPTFPAHARYRGRIGLENPSFLDIGLLQEAFLRRLEPYRNQVGVLVFEFGAFLKRKYESVELFLADLDPFLKSLPQDFRYAVEIRNKEYLQRPYFDCLRSHNVAHVFNAWTRMPPLESQVEISDAYTADFIVCRALLRHGRTFEAAVKEFSPYSHIVDPNPEARGALRELIDRALEKQRKGFIYVGNRLEGNSPLTIQEIVQDA